MRVFPLVCLGVLLLAGCAAGPFDGSDIQDNPIELVLNNSANVTNMFTVHVVDLPATMTAHYRDGTVVESEIGEGLSNHDTGPRTVTEIEFPTSTRRNEFTLQPGEEVQRSIENFSRDAAPVVVVSRDEDEIFSWVSANCADRPLIGLEVTARPNPPGGVSASYGCR